MCDTLNKLPIQDPSIRILASKELKKFIGKSLQISSTTPAAVKEIHSSFGSGRRGKPAKKTNLPNEENELKQPNVEFTTKERRYIDQLVAEFNTKPSELNTTGFMETEHGTQREPNTESNETLLSLGDVQWLYTTLNEMRQTDTTVPYLHTLLAGCLLKLPENPIQERNPELEARCQRLRKEQEDREYQRMTKNVDTVRKHMPEDTISYQMKQINRHLIAVAQFLFSVAAGFAFGFIGIELLIGQLDFGFRLLLGIIIALVIALAEIYFLAKKLNEEYELPPQPAFVSKGKPSTVFKTSPATKSVTGKEHNE
uniref:Endoplasmic reticulum-based factor for assembly of V-ATPase n=1 Tax=Anopheles farauti TaxID=69004 RepID=A0A182QXE2_9DIPT